MSTAIPALVKAAFQCSRFMPSSELAMTVGALGDLVRLGVVPIGLVTSLGTRVLVKTVIDGVQDMSSADIGTSLKGLAYLQLANSSIREHLVKHFLRAGHFSPCGVSHLVLGLEGCPTDTTAEVLRLVTAAAPSEIFSSIPSEDIAEIALIFCDQAAKLPLDDLPWLAEGIARMEPRLLVRLCPLLDGAPPTPALDKIFLAVARCVGASSDSIGCNDSTKFLMLLASALHVFDNGKDPVHQAEVKALVHRLCTRARDEAKILPPDGVCRALAAFVHAKQHDPEYVAPLIGRLTVVMPETRAPNIGVVVESLWKLGYSTHPVLRTAFRRAAALVQEFSPSHAAHFLGILRQACSNDDELVQSVANEFASYFVPVLCTDGTGVKQGQGTVVIRIPIGAAASELTMDDAVPLRILKPKQQKAFELHRVYMEPNRMNTLAPLFRELCLLLPKSTYTRDAAAVLMMAAPELSTEGMLATLEGLALVPSLTDSAVSEVLLRSLLDALDSLIMSFCASGDPVSVSAMLSSLRILHPYSPVASEVFSKALGILAQCLPKYDDTAFATLITVLSKLLEGHSGSDESPLLLQSIESRLNEKMVNQLDPPTLVQAATAITELGSRNVDVSEVFLTRIFCSPVAEDCVFKDLGGRELQQLLSSACHFLKIGREKNPNINQLDWRSLPCAPMELALRVARAGEAVHPFDFITMLSNLGDLGIYTTDPSETRRVLLPSNFFKAIAVRFIAVAPHMPPKSLLAILKSLEALQSTILIPERRNEGSRDSWEPVEVPLVRCVFSRAAELRGTSVDAENDLLISMAVRIAETCGSLIPEAVMLRNTPERTSDPVDEPISRLTHLKQPSEARLPSSSLEAAFKAFAKQPDTPRTVPAEGTPPVLHTCDKSRETNSSNDVRLPPKDAPATKATDGSRAFFERGPTLQPAAGSAQSFKDIFDRSAAAIPATLFKTNPTLPATPERDPASITSQATPHVTSARTPSTVIPPKEDASDVGTVQSLHFIDEEPFSEPTIPLPPNPASGLNPTPMLHTKFQVASQPNLVLHNFSAPPKSVSPSGNQTAEKKLTRQEHQRKRPLFSSVASIHTSDNSIVLD